ncbi:hypothetical protein L873DRAFT_1786196 [Choiromyces venosus 120613-1]|uniref:Uncharacterized protein n=1 Tax=Choiromyces venosus 120613-1 TaxID=1336337 RepID=A0A3N4K4T9_9PEZI|nr:hypothetical protein L873DRAFT_1786196 [Choiromyces venosus 120613-1]
MTVITRRNRICKVLKIRRGTLNARGGTRSVQDNGRTMVLPIDQSRRVTSVRVLNTRVSWRRAINNVVRGPNICDDAVSPIDASVGRRVHTEYESQRLEYPGYESRQTACFTAYCRGEGIYAILGSIAARTGGTVASYASGVASSGTDTSTTSW